MTGAASKLRPLTSIVVSLLVFAAWLPGRAWASGPAVAAADKTTASDSTDEVADTGTRLMVMRDFNHDGIADIAEATASAGNSSAPDVLTVSLGQADGTFKRTALRLPLGHTPHAMVSGDFNKDGIPDLIVGDEDGALMLFLGDGRGNLVPAGEVAHLDSVVSIVVADFNHDGIPDLAVSDWRASTVKVLLGTGNGSFQSGWSSPLRLAGTTPHLSAADFNGDGVTDLAVVYSDDDGDTFDVMLGDGHGGFSPSPQLSLVKDPNAHCAP
jgi:hypothetical protein